MAIDDLVGIVIRQANDEVESESYLPAKLAKLGLSGSLAVALVKLPFVSQVLISLLSNSTGRFERRFIQVAEALNDQQKRIEDKIPDQSYYESEEFQTLLGLVIERLHTTRDEEKLKMFGNALANSGNSDFKADHREDFIRILRDLSIADIDELKSFARPSAQQFGGTLNEEQRFQMRQSRQNIKGEGLSRTTRLVGLGLINESLTMKRYGGSVEFRNAREASRALEDYLKQPPTRSYEISSFGWRFLQFIEGEAGHQTGIE